MRKTQRPRSVSSIFDDSINLSFERSLADLFSMNHCLGFSSGSHAILTALLAADVDRESEVILGPCGWGQALAAVALIGATPVIVDCDPMGGVCPSRAAQAITPRTRAILAVCPNGIADDLVALHGLARRSGLVLINDASRASRLIQRMPADIHCVSLGPSKLLDAGEGGAILTNSDEIFEKTVLLSQHPLRAYRDVLNSGRRRAVSEFFVSSRMSPLHAHLGTVAVANFQSALVRRRAAYRRLAQRIDRALRACAGVEVDCPARDRLGDYARIIRWVTSARTPADLASARLAVSAKLGRASVCAAEQSLIDKLARTDEAWAPAFVRVAARRARIVDDLPTARRYCRSLLAIEAAPYARGHRFPGRLPRGLRAGRRNG